ncbi:hypothetical protein CL646_05845 [bacterium]|nr:hypothetical protein [bacterium]|tara:strand:+ start:56 stop:580 length:525 start_codon:yes stop_codon:yes gene_type:complete
MEKVNQLPKTIKLFNFAKREVKLHGQYKIANMSRLSEIARNNNDIVYIDLSFHLENRKTACVHGIIKLKLVLDCQRCLEDLKIDLNVPFRIAFVSHELEVNGLDNQYEIYIIGENEELETIDLITDEILLSIPMAPSHNFACGFKAELNKVSEEKQKHPFDVLKKIKIADLGKE